MKLACFGFGGHGHQCSANRAIPMALRSCQLSPQHFPRIRKGLGWGWATTAWALTQPVIPSRATRLRASDHQMGLGRKSHVLRDTISQGAHQSVTAERSSNVVVEMVQFPFWYLLEQSPLLFTSRIFWNHLSNGNIPLVLLQGEITLMMVERPFLGLGSQRSLSCRSWIWQFSLVGCKPRNDISPGDAKPQAETTWKPWTDFFFPTHKFWKWIFHLLPAAEAIPPGAVPHVCHGLSKQGCSLWAEVSPHILQRAAKGKHLALALPCHPMLPLQGWSTNTRVLGLLGEAKQNSLLWNER